MKETIFIKYFHPVFQIGLENVRNAWLLNTAEPVKLTVVVYQGSLSYRLPGSGKRISYRLLKRGLIKKNVIIERPFALLPF